MLYLLHQAIDRCAESYPDKAAFSYQAKELSYRDLMLLANRVAVELIAVGVSSGDRVGLLLPKCLEMPIGVFGCLKAGAVVVPLDAQSPLDRLTRIITDAEIRHLIVSPEQAALVSKLSVEENLDIQFIIGLESHAKIPLPARAWSELTPTDQLPSVKQIEDDAAYLLYTSGSTGEPKGILHSHRSGLAYARLSAAAYDVRKEDRLGNFAPLHFDQSTFDFYTGPLCGATTVLIPQAFGIALASLAELIEAEKLTIWYSVPSVLVQLVLRDALQGKDLSNLRWVLFGGEPFPPKHLQKLMDLIPHAVFSNVYGPTEVNQCTYFNVRGCETVDDSLPIGRVWDNSEGLVVDNNDDAVPVGEIGELLIRSPTMMLGYWRRPELNKRALHKRPRDDGGDDLFYRTGDLVRARKDGNLEFVGRKDRQVKTRGYRVELDEIEAVLCRYDGVQEAATFTVEDDQQAVVIDAAVIIRDGCDLTERELRAHVARYLPGYARPRQIVVLPEFPRTRTGKVDRQALVDLSK